MDTSAVRIKQLSGKPHGIPNPDTKARMQLADKGDPNERLIRDATSNTSAR